MFLFMEILGIFLEVKFVGCKFVDVLSFVSCIFCDTRFYRRSWFKEVIYVEDELI